MKKIIEYFQNKILEILWKSSPKKEILIAGEKIQYLPVNKFFIYNVPRMIPDDGLCLTRRSTKTLMIFISHRQCRGKSLKYILYHEFIEGNYHLQEKDLFEKFESQLAQKVEYLEKNFPQVLEIFEKAFSDGQEKGHLIALIFELNLAAEELDPVELDNHIKIMLSERI